MDQERNIKISVAVTTHPKYPERRTNVERILARHSGLDIRVVSDPDPDGPPSGVRTARLAWEAIAEDATHHLVLEDDVEPVEAFSDQLYQAVRAQPEAVISLNVASTSRCSFSARVAALNKKAWAPAIGSYVPTVAAVLPARLARGFARYIPAQPILRGIDMVLKNYLDAFPEEVPRLTTVPNLCEHLPLPSIEGQPTPDGRQAVCLMRRTHRATIWSSPPATPSLVPYLTPYPHRNAVAFVGDVIRRPLVRPALEQLNEYGVRLDRLAMAFTRSIPKHSSLIDTVGDILFQLWCTAAILGVACKQVAQEPTAFDVHEALADPLASETVSSWAEGVIQKRTVPELRMGLANELARFLTNGIIFGSCAFIDTGKRR